TLGRVKFTGNNIDDIWAALIASGSVLFGSPDEAIKVSSYLMDARMSRTTSYICCLAKNCSQVIDILNNIRNSEVVILGCGGIGSLAALLLAGAGIKRLRLIDPDVIEASNLNRQLIWKLSDIGQPKVEILKRELLERFSDLDIQILQKSSSEKSLSKDVTGANAVLLTADEPSGLSVTLQRIAKRKKIVLIATGYLLREAGVTLSTTDFRNGGDVKWMTSPFSVMPSFGPTNAELAGLSCALLIHSISGLLPPKQKYFSAYWDVTCFPREMLSESVKL
ncbi:MAG TPA: ThiF family adenylyltransferase, partial [Pyrinomonadaceae bacterium]